MMLLSNGRPEYDDKQAIYGVVYYFGSKHENRLFFRAHVVQTYFMNLCLLLLLLNSVYSVRCIIAYKNNPYNFSYSKSQMDFFL